MRVRGDARWGWSEVGVRFVRLNSGEVAVLAVVVVDVGGGWWVVVTNRLGLGVARELIPITLGRDGKTDGAGGSLSGSGGKSREAGW
jgi:hypothetical protein